MVSPCQGEGQAHRGCDSENKQKLQDSDTMWPKIELYPKLGLTRDHSVGLKIKYNRF